MNTRITRPILALLLVTLAGSCRSVASWLPGGPERIPAKLDAARVPHAIERAEADLATGDSARALEWMRAASRSSGLTTEQRETVQSLLEKAADTRMHDLSRPGADPDELADMLDLDLPRQIAVTAGVRAARMMFEAGEPMDAYRLIKKVDTKFPLHHERAQAGDLLFEIGSALAADKSSFLGLFKKTDDAQEVLEYLILYYPWATGCDRAYVTLAQLYEDDHEWELAIDRHEKLVLNHPSSPLRPASQAAVPRLRLRALKSPEYDRSELLQARRELDDWLRTLAGDPTEARVRLDLGDCLRRLSDNDLVVARFYRRVGNAYGSRQHAERALDEARAAQDDGRTRAAESFLSKLAKPTEPSPGGAIAPAHPTATTTAAPTPAPALPKATP